MVELAGAAIAVRGVSKRFGRRGSGVQALRDVTLAVAPGEIYGLLGRNGAGKTTLVKVLLDIVRADGGEALLGGRPSRSASARRDVGYLPEDHHFPEYQTGESALRFHAALSRCPAPAAGKSFADLLGWVGLGGAARRKVRGYSKGMKQRLGLAAALVGDPRILFLDEPTDGVDPVGRAQFRDLILEMKKEGRTIFLNSHLLSEIERVCDRVGILREGRLVKEGSLESLLRSVDRAYAIGTDRPVDDGVLAAVRGLAPAASRTAEGVEVTVKADADIDGIIDLLRSRRIGIRSLGEKKLSLEDVFLAAVGGKGGEKGGEA